MYEYQVLINTPAESISYGSSEMSAVTWWAVNIGTPVHHCLTVVAKDGLFRDAVLKPGQAKRSLWIPYRLYNQPERPLKMKFEDKSHVSHQSCVKSQESRCTAWKEGRATPRPSWYSIVVYLGQQGVK